MSVLDDLAGLIKCRFVKAKIVEVINNCPKVPSLLRIEYGTLWMHVNWQPNHDFEIHVVDSAKVRICDSNPYHLVCSPDYIHNTQEQTFDRIVEILNKYNHMEPWQ